jgi:hypothetical protein
MAAEFDMVIGINARVIMWMAEAFGGLGLLAENRAYVATPAKLLISISTFFERLSIFLRPLRR